MFKTPEKTVRVVCVILAALVLWEISRAVTRSLPLRKLEIPAVPSLALSATNSAADAKKGTNGVASSTNSATKALPNVATNNSSSNRIAAAGKSQGNTNNVALSETNAASPLRTNASLLESNSVGVLAANKITNTNQGGTNSIVPGKNGTNLASTMKPGRPGGGMPGMPGGPMAGNSGPRPEIPPATKARIDRITQSEILGMVMHPMPMALLGIAGDEAFLRSPEGQTGAIKEGAQLGTLKLIQIGTNRVLVEQDGQKKELMIFAGLGGDSLMPKEKTKTNEIKKPNP